MTNRSQVAWVSLLLLIVALLAVLGTSGCVGEGEREAAVSNPDYNVRLLFVDEHGCRVMRFHDWRYVYYVVCPDGVTRTSHQESCGKNCTRDVEVPTVVR